MRALSLKLLVSHSTTTWLLWGIGTVSLLAAGWSWHAARPYLFAGGAASLAFVLYRLVWRYRRRMRRRSRLASLAQAPFPPLPRQPVDPHDLNAVVEQMLAQGRCALLLRPQIARTLEERHFQQAREWLEEDMGLVPDGDVVLGALDDLMNNGKLDDEMIRQRHGRIVRVEHFFLDRYPVTNAEYYEFVSAGGYQQVALWEPTILPAVLDFVDSTGHPGPRYWQHGCYAQDQADHPVVGVSWYEAQAYARWIGKRLPTDAEWVKAGSWPVQVSATTRLQRKYPWGEAMDHNRVNLWVSGHRGTVSVEDYPEGVSVGGIYQLIGNVWEWTRGSYQPVDTEGEEWLLEDSLKSIRGGAFDTYFDNQATCQFQSGEYPLSRRHNLGFRCAVGVCDLLLTRKATPQATAEPDEASLEEVSA